MNTNRGTVRKRLPNSTMEICSDRTGNDRVDNDGFYTKSGINVLLQKQKLNQINFCQQRQNKKPFYYMICCKD